MVRHRLAPDVDEFAKPLELGSISQGAVAVNGVIFIESKKDELFVLGCKAGLVVVGHESCGHTAGVVIAAMQPRLVYDAGFFKQLLLLFYEANRIALARQVQRRIAAENAATDDEIIVFFELSDGGLFLLNSFQFAVNILIFCLRQRLIKVNVRL
jgi:hypothetical protein